MKTAGRWPSNLAAGVSVALFISAPFAILTISSHGGHVLLIYGVLVRDPLPYASTAAVLTVMAGSSVLPIAWLGRRREEMRRRQDHRCLACGYDLRATPHRCPECGAVPEHPHRKV